MSKILVAFEVKNNTTDNNINSLLTVLSRMETDVQVIKSSRIEECHIQRCDVLILNRPNSIYSQEILKAAKKAGRYCVVSLDDDIINLPKSHPDYWKRKYTLACLGISDALMSPNPLILADYCAKNGLKPIRTNSFIEEKDLKSLHQVNEKLRVVYPAGRDHLPLFDKYILPFFDSFISRYANKIDVTFIGVQPKVNQSDSVHFIKGMPYKDYLEYMDSHEFDIGLAPLDDTPFCARKYFAKYFEYGKYGIMGLYSNVSPYTIAIEDGVNGLLVEDSIDAWESALVKVVESPSIIVNITKKAQEDLKNSYSLDAVVQSLRNECPELETFNGLEEKVEYGTSVLSKVRFELKSNCKKIVYHGRNEGLDGLCRIFLSKLGANTQAPLS